MHNCHSRTLLAGIQYAGPLIEALLCESRHGGVQLTGHSGVIEHLLIIFVSVIMFCYNS